MHEYDGEDGHHVIKNLEWNADCTRIKNLFMTFADPFTTIQEVATKIKAHRQRYEREQGHRHTDSILQSLDEAQLPVKAV